MAAKKGDAKGQEQVKKDEPARGSSRTPSNGKVRRPTPDPDGDDANYVDVDDPAAAYVDAAVKSTPWWAMSLAFHGLVLASLPLIIFSQKFLSEEQRTVQITIKQQPVTRILDMDERQRGIIDQTGVVGEVKADLPKIDFPDAVVDNHYESADGEDYGQMKGQSWDNRSSTWGEDGGIGRQPGKGPGVNISMGVGGGSGGGGRYGGPFGGRFNRKPGRCGATVATESAVTAGLAWLARHQSEDGSWSAAHFQGQCKGDACQVSGMPEFDVGVTGLALLAFLGAGYTPSNRATYIDPVTHLTMRNGEVVRKGVQFLIDHQDSDGRIGPQVGELMYNHSIATFALCEAYGLTNAVCYRAPAQKAVMYLSLAQNDSLRGTGRRAWRYTPRCGQNDTSVTGWCVMALKSAQLSGLDVSQSAYDGAKQFITDMTDSTGKVGYLKPGEDNTVASGINEDWACHRAMTAVGLLSRIFIDKKKGDPAMGQAVKHLMSDLPRWDPSLKTEKPADFYYWYYGTYALNQYEGATNGANWTRWNKVVGDILCTTQCTKKDGCANGSWPAEHDRWAHYGGRVYGTAMNVLTLEVYYRMVNVFGGEKRSDK